MGSWVCHCAWVRGYIVVRQFRGGGRVKLVMQVATRHVLVGRGE